MGERGPVGKRSEERIRRNAPEVPVTKIEAAGVVDQPELGLEDPHSIITDLWDTMGESAQSQFYEPSDWAFARYVFHFADGLLKSSRPSAQMFAGVASSMTDLLISEGSRRRVHMEIERNKAEASVTDISAVIKERMGIDKE